MSTPPILWRPDTDRRERATLTGYTRWLEQTRGLDLPDYARLWEWSTTDLEGFWASIWEYFDVLASTPYERVLGSRAMPGAEWFTGARLNFAEHALRARNADAVAIRHASELRPLAEMTRGELRDEVTRLAGGLRALGVGQGDRVAAYLPNIPEAVAAFLACASIGAIWSSCSPDFGARSVIDRFAQIEPRVLLAVDGYRYGGKDFDRTAVLGELQAALPTVEHTVVLGYLDPDPALAGLRDAVPWGHLRTMGEGAPLRFEQLPFDHPLWVLYSSGTTGLPKPIVHGHGGILLEMLKKMHLHVDLQAHDRLLWFTTTGWMMWNFLVGSLTTEASIVLYDGNPGSPDLGVLWDLVEAAGVTCFGTSAAFIGGCQKAGLRPAEGRDLSALASVGSTGSPLSHEGFAWVYDTLGEVWLFSTSGGTDVCTAFVGGVPTLPVYQGELQARALGARVEAWSPEGVALVGEVGELVLTEPMPSMPLFFWGDADGSRYRESYFEMFPGVWRHGDWIEISDRGTAIISGRSDATINRGGIRMGTSEIYSAVLTFDEVVDALVLDLPLPGTDGFMPLFVVLRDGTRLDDELVTRIRRRIREDCSPRHVPDLVEQIAEVPRTLSGKALELPVKRILLGAAAETTVSRDALASPSALEPFEEMARRPPYASVS
jgi:acetoacetyl-CoA synthetase